VCGHPLRASSPRVPALLCSHCKIRVSASGDTGIRGVGDIVEKGLASIGITKRRVQVLASLVGIEDCGCEERQAALNSMFPIGDKR